MELDESDSESDHDGNDDASKLKKTDRKQKFEIGKEATDCFQSLSSDLKSGHVVLKQLLKLAGGQRPSKDLALVGMHDEIAKSMSTIQRLRTALEVGSVSATVKELKKQ